MGVRFSVIVVLFLCSCSGLEQTEYNKIRKKNLTGERILRKHDEHFDLTNAPTLQKKESYFWESAKEEYLPRITKDFFRCRGHNFNAKKVLGKKILEDCMGSSKHSLPIIHGKENVYPVLMDLLNHIQKKTKKKIVITCGYRCPQHNAYAEPYTEDSLHMMGAEVDFYVRGMEDQAEKIVELIIEYYQVTSIYKNKPSYQKFQRMSTSDTKEKIWINKEICLKVYQKNEGRDFDNRHPYSYITIQVRYDKDLQENVSFSQEKAMKGFYKW